jgi:hypothetical protein
MRDERCLDRTWLQLKLNMGHGMNNGDMNPHGSSEPHNVIRLVDYWVFRIYLKSYNVSNYWLWIAWIRFVSRYHVTTSIYIITIQIWSYRIPWYCSGWCHKTDTYWHLWYSGSGSDCLYSSHIRPVPDKRVVVRLNESELVQFAPLSFECVVRKCSRSWVSYGLT